MVKMLKGVVIMAKKENRVVFVVSDVELKALEILSEFEDSQSALLRRLIREEALKQKIWVKAKQESKYGINLIR